MSAFATVARKCFLKQLAIFSCLIYSIDLIVSISASDHKFEDDATGNHFDDCCIMRRADIDQQVLGVWRGSTAQEIPTRKGLEMEGCNRRGLKRSGFRHVGYYQVGPTSYVLKWTGQSWLLYFILHCTPPDILHRGEGLYLDRVAASHSSVDKIRTISQSLRKWRQFTGQQKSPNNSFKDTNRKFTSRRVFKIWTSHFLLSKKKKKAFKNGRAKLNLIIGLIFPLKIRPIRKQDSVSCTTSYI